MDPSHNTIFFYMPAKAQFIFRLSKRSRIFMRENFTVADEVFYLWSIHDTYSAISIHRQERDAK